MSVPKTLEDLLPALAERVKKLKPTVENWHEYIIRFKIHEDGTINFDCEEVVDITAINQEKILRNCKPPTNSVN